MSALLSGPNADGVGMNLEYHARIDHAACGAAAPRWRS